MPLLLPRTFLEKAELGKQKFSFSLLGYFNFSYLGRTGSTGVPIGIHSRCVLIMLWEKEPSSGYELDYIRAKTLVFESLRRIIRQGDEISKIAQATIKNDPARPDAVYPIFSDPLPYLAPTRTEVMPSFDRYQYKTTSVPVIELNAKKVLEIEGRPEVLDGDLIRSLYLWDIYSSGEGGGYYVDSMNWALDRQAVWLNRHRITEYPVLLDPRRDVNDARDFLLMRLLPPEQLVLDVSIKDWKEAYPTFYYRYVKYKINDDIPRRLDEAKSQVDVFVAVRAVALRHLYNSTLKMAFKKLGISALNPEMFPKENIAIQLWLNYLRFLESCHRR